MNTKIDKIKLKINVQTKIEEQIVEIDSILNKHKYKLNEEEVLDLIKEKEECSKKLIVNNLDFSKKNQDFFYTKDEIKNADEISWFIKNTIPMSTIGVFIGPSGSGKTTVLHYYLQQVLERNSNVYLVFIDGDMSIQKLKENNIDVLLEKHSERFFYAGKQNAYFSDRVQNLLKDIVELQKKYKDRKYIVVEDSLSLTAKKKRGFIDTELLYKNEKELRAVGGTSIIIHHTNKSGMFADSQHIENFADYTYLIERNSFNSAILLYTQKASRYDIKNVAFKVENRKIISEIDFTTANISIKEITFINFVLEALEDGEMNQSEVINHLEKMRFFAEQKVGQRKVTKWLKKWADEKKWSYEQKAEKKNAIYYYLKEEDKTAKHEKLDKLHEKGLL